MRRRRRLCGRVTCAVAAALCRPRHTPRRVLIGARRGRWCLDLFRWLAVIIKESFVAPAERLCALGWSWATAGQVAGRVLWRGGGGVRCASCRRRRQRKRKPAEVRRRPAAPGRTGREVKRSGAGGTARMDDLGRTCERPQRKPHRLPSATRPPRTPPQRHGCRRRRRGLTVCVFRRIAHQKAVNVW